MQNLFRSTVPGISSASAGVQLHNEFVRPCLYCNREELHFLQNKYKSSEEECWHYKLLVDRKCSRCEHFQFEERGICSSIMHHLCGVDQERRVVIPLPLTLVGTVERAVNAASTGKKGAEFRPHATFIHHLTLLGTTELHKQALCTWAPLALRSFMDGMPGVTRRLSAGRPAKTTFATPERPSLSPESANPDIQDGKMMGVCLEGNEYGEEERVSGEGLCPPEEQQCATQIGPDLIPTEAFGSTIGNVKAGAAKRIKPPPYKATRQQERKIYKTVNALLDNVFSRKRIIAWREENPDFDEMKSKKWSTERWRNAVQESLADIVTRIEQECQIKKNEALPSKGKAPRPIIQSGDSGQVIMAFAVKCFEELLFEYFEQASIKHVSKHEAMQRVAAHLRQKNAHIIEGDGSAWDACCNWNIRKQTENRIIKHIIDILGEDAEVPKSWLNECLKDMEKPELYMKCKVKDHAVTPFRILIDSIRQSGHRGTSCFNWLINYVCWICVISDSPWDLVPKVYSRSGPKLQEEYISAFDGCKYLLKYAFEGDDSAISTTENLKKHEKEIMELWTKLGFNMKLVYADKLFTFTGYNFLCDEQGPTQRPCFIPEPARNIASSSWSTSSLLLSDPGKTHEVGAAAMLARAQNFGECGPLSAYFAALGLAHMAAGQVKDFGLDDVEAMRLGIETTDSVREELTICAIKAGPMTKQQRKLMREIVPTFTHEHEMRLLTADFGNNPYDVSLAKTLIPFELWDPAQYESPRRRRN